MNSNAFKPTLAALFAALIVVGAYLAIPFIPVPLVLANFFAILAGLVLGPLWGGIAVALYLVLGAIGMPLFAGGTGGFAHFATPTGGFLLGYLASAIAAGLVSHGLADFRRVNTENKPAGVIRLLLASLVALAVLYAIGLPWFQNIMSAKAPAKFPDITAAFWFMSPYLIGDAVKVVAAAFLARSLRPLLQ